MPLSLRDLPLSAGLLAGLALFAGATAPAHAATPDIGQILGLIRGAPAEFRVRGSNGYTIRVEGSGNAVTLSASGPDGTAVYTVRGRASTGSIVANFGSRGKVDVEFKPSRRTKVEPPPKQCRGKPRVTRWGRFVGKVRFHGERGYTSFESGSVPGRTNVSPSWRCKRFPDDVGREPSLPGETSEDSVVLELANGRTGLEAAAFAFRPAGEKGLTFFVAGINERSKRMQIARYALTIAREQAFSFDSALSSATIAPPRPFSGSATYQGGAGAAPTWIGDLAVSLPGTASLSLVGPDYRPRLYRLSEDGIAIPAI
jgi:hypothetical protein